MADPTRRAALLALAERCERASEGSADLNADIVWEIVCDYYRQVIDGVRHVAVAVGPQGPWFLPLADRAQDAPQYSRSLDAALSLVPEGWVPDIQVLCRGAGADVDIYQCGTGRKARVRAATPALALTAAALRARARAAMEE